MMRRTALSCLLLCSVAAAAFADGQKEITLGNGHKEETVTLPSLCNIFVTLTADDDEGGTLSISMENIREDGGPLLIFDKDYSERQLWRLRPRIVYHKTFGGTRGMRETDFIPGLAGMEKADHLDNMTLLQAEVRNGEQQIVRIPIYSAKLTGIRRSRIGLVAKHVVELVIRVELKPDEDYIRLSSEAGSYMKLLGRKPFCTHALHTESLEKQKEPYLRERERMIRQIDSIQRMRRWSQEDRGYRKYDSLKAMLQEIDMDSPEYQTADCGKEGMHRKMHSCRYCGLSLAQIYHKLDDYYQEIYSSSDRAAAKRAVIGEVRALYRCCTDPDCSRHSSEWRRGGSYKSKITDRYNRINGL